MPHHSIPPPETDCRHCRHYFITYDMAFRHGCRALDFKSARPPGLEVLEAYEQPCQFFPNPNAIQDDPRPVRAQNSHSRPVL